MDRKTLEDTSKFLSYVLRHQPEAIGLTLDGEGWARRRRRLANRTGTHAVYPRGLRRRRCGGRIIASGYPLYGLNNTQAGDHSLESVAVRQVVCVEWSMPVEHPVFQVLNTRFTSHEGDHDLDEVLIGAGQFDAIEQEENRGGGRSCTFISVCKAVIQSQAFCQYRS